jgi:pyruvate dehydrogenase E2 component (dihydrolipoamide acetyltransferase)
MEFGTIISWEKKEGDKLNEGDLLAEIETDKATMGLETPEEGYLAKIVVPAGTKDVAIGKLVCIITENASDVAAFKDFKDDQAPPAAKPKAAAKTPSALAPASAPTPKPPAAAAPVSAAPGQGQGRPFISPLARALAASRGIDLSTLPSTGTGFAGSITSKDLANVGSAPAASAAVSGVPSSTSAASYRDIPVSGMRSVIAKRLLQSKQTIPHYYVTTQVSMDNVLRLRSEFNKQLEKSGEKISVNDFIIKASAAACLKIPEVNSSWQGDTIREYSSVDVSIAVSTPKGLITPIIFGAESKGLVEISSNMKDLAKRARDGKLQPAEFQGGTFSISNLGMYGVHHFSAIINPPQAAILAVGGTVDQLVQKGDGYSTSTVMFATLSCDHRVVDGAVAAQWLQAFKLYLGNPAGMLL